MEEEGVTVKSRDLVERVRFEVVQKDTFPGDNEYYPEHFGRMMEQVYGELFIFGQKNGEVKVFYVDGNGNRYITFEYDIFLKNKKTS